MNYDNYDQEEDDDLAALFVLGDLYRDEIRRNKKSGGGCLTTVLMFALIPIVLTIIVFKA